MPVRHLFDRVIFSQNPPLRLAACNGCGTVYRNPREEPDALVDTYASEEPSAEKLERLYENQRSAYLTQAERLAEVAGSSGSGLEVGSYIGAFLGAAPEHGWSFEGVDVNPSAVAFARGRGFRVHEGTIMDLGRERSYDAVAFWNCFDQLPDPRASARAARRILRRDGVLAIRVPNGAYYARWRVRLSRSAGPAARLLLSHNNLLGFPYRHGFTPGSIELLLRSCGFDPIRSVGDTLVPVADDWTRPWAALEERMVKAAIRATSSNAPRMPWFEIYARAV